MTNESWNEMKLRNLVHFRTGKLDSNAATTEGEYPFFTCSRETLRTDTYSFDTECVLLAGNNANGVFPIKYFSGRFDAYQRTYVIESRDLNQLDIRFLYYALQPKLELFQRVSTGVTTKFLTLEILNNVEMLIPPFTVQRKIMSMLSAYDDLIENNCHRIQLLEEMARALYREWFVHFRFPGHKEVELVDSELGEIPEGWRITNVLSAIDLNPKINLTKTGTKKYISMMSVSTDSMMVSAIESRNGNTGSKFKNGDTLFPQINPSLQNGKMAYVQFLDEEEIGLGTGELIVMRSKTLCPEFVYLLASTYEFRENAIKSMIGASGRQRVQKECFETFYFTHPDDETLDKFQRTVSPIFKLAQSLWDTNNRCSLFRDILLPKLVSGQLDVSDLKIEIPPDTHKTSKYENEQSIPIQRLDGDEEDV